MTHKKVRAIMVQKTLRIRFLLGINYFFGKINDNCLGCPEKT